MTQQELGISGEERVRNWLNGYGIKSEHAGYSSPYDLICDGRRIEVKTASMCADNGIPTWRVNIHRHGKLDESNVDFYVIRLEDFPGMKAALHLVVPSPIERSTLNINMRNLILRWSKYANAIDLIKPGSSRPTDDFKESQQ
jgi:hypothetical protein